MTDIFPIFVIMKTIRIFLAVVVMILAAQAQCFSQTQDRTEATDGFPLRLAVAGVTHGHLGEVLARIDRGDFLVVGVFEENDTYRSENDLRRHLPDNRFYKDLRKMLDETKPEAVVAYGSIKDHLAVVEACAPRHIHVMVEKPLATTVKEAKRMRDLAQKHGIMVLTNYETSWYPANHQAKAIIDEGTIGKLFKINVYDGHQGPFEIGCAPRFTDWLCDPVLNGGGAVKDFGCYGANIATWLLGGMVPERVNATLRQVKPDKYPKVDDDATITVEYPGVTVQIMASWCWPYNRKDMWVYGLNGYVHQDTSRQMETLINGQKSGLFNAPALRSPYDDSFRYLKAAVRGEITVLPEDLASIENNVIVVKILEAAKKSSRTGKSVRIR